MGLFAVEPQAVVGYGFDLEIFADGPIDAPKTHIRLVRMSYPARAPDGVKTTADSRRCPGIHARIKALADAEAAQAAIQPRNSTVLDGTVIAIDAPRIGDEHEARMVLKSNDQMDAIQKWLFDTQAYLKDCWKPA